MRDDVRVVILIALGLVKAMQPLVPRVCLEGTSVAAFARAKCNRAGATAELLSNVAHRLCLAVAVAVPKVCEHAWVVVQVAGGLDAVACTTEGQAQTMGAEGK